MTPDEYHTYLCNQYEIYNVLEIQAEANGVLVGIENIKRADKILADIEELEEENPSLLKHADDNFGELICSVTVEYIMYISKLVNYNRLLAHVYVRHFGDMYGGQMIAKRNPGSGKMYEFENVDELKEIVRSRLDDEMSDEANMCFQFAIQLFNELEKKATQKSNVVLESDNGIISIALKLYAERVEEMEGSPELADRALQLYLEYRDKTDE
jgi:heme oxygenase